jgi:phage gp45-like
MPDLFRGRVLAIDDSGDLQLARFTGYAGEELVGAHRVQPHGFHSVPPVGAHVIGMRVRGQSDLAACFGGEVPQYRPKNRDPGTACLYDQWGNIVSVIQTEGRFEHTTKLRFKVGSMVVVIQANRIDLGADPAPHAVQTADGPSTKVFAVI